MYSGSDMSKKGMNKKCKARFDFDKISGIETHKKSKSYVNSNAMEPSTLSYQA